VARHEDLAVNDKTFAYLSVAGEPFALSCKLPRSAGAALGFPFAKPTGYGLRSTPGAPRVAAKRVAGPSRRAR
jgi:hypothetical protein